MASLLQTVFPNTNPMTMLFPVLLLAALALFFYRYYQASSPTPGTLEWIRHYDRPRFTLSGRRYPMERKDILPLCIITAVYAVVGFFLLGSTEAPQTFYQFNDTDQSVTIDLGDSYELSTLWYYTGLYTGEYTLWVSDDGQDWQQLFDDDGGNPLTQTYAQLFKWRETSLDSAETDTIRYIFIAATNRPMELGELALFDRNGDRLDLSYLRDTAAGALFDEQDTVPDEISWYNSMYFDEIYHGRTAYEHLNNVKPYEITHPPLGKIVIMCAIKVFGMTPFGWRFAGCLFGVLMLIPFYIFVKNLFGKTPVAVCGTLVFAFDFMHYTQTRIATIDTYAVFYIILSYLFLYRWMTVEYDAPLKKTVLPLFLSGLCFGLGCASKWTVIYAGVGLAILYVIALVCRGRERTVGGFGGHLVATLALSVVFFIVVPGIIYCLSYIPYGLAQGLTFPELLVSKDYYKIIWDNQVYMLTYHQGVDQAHPYASRWYQWIVDARPILYYLHYKGDMKSAFGCFNNPLVSWGGLLALGSLLVSWRRRHDTAIPVIWIGYLSQLGPWLLIGRTTFAYHYFPSLIFLVLALCYVFDRLWTCGQKRMVYGFTGGCIALFAAFYPVLSGITVPTWYTYYFLKWFPSWPFS
jgi:predicted membrane-bound dolichyl-phosphate-mannose-protein mannosyltransferase